MFEKIFSWFECRYKPLELQPNPAIPSGVGAFISYFVSQFKGGLSLVVLGIGSLAVIDVMKPVALGWLVDLLTTTNRETIFADYGWAFSIAGVVVLLIAPLVLIFTFLVMHQTLFPVMFTRIRAQLHWYVLRQSWPYFQNDFAGRIAAKADQTTHALRDMTMNSADALCYAAIYLITAITALMSADWRLAMPLLVWLVIIATYVGFMVRKLADASEKVSDARSTLTGAIIDSYTNIQLVKMFALNKHEDSYAADKLMDAQSTSERFFRVVNGIWLPLELCNYVMIATSAAYGLYLWQQGVVSTGALAMALPLVIRLAGMSNWITGVVTRIFENIGTIRDGEKLIAQPWTITDADHAKELQISGGEIHFDGVKFSYSPEESSREIVIDNINLRVKAGEKIGLIGRSGAGKSTLVNLLLRFFELDEGRITIDGQSIKDVTQDSLRSNIAMVSQDSSLLHRSIRDNILIGKPGATEEDMFRVARQASAHDFILGLEDGKGRKGYEAHAGERGVRVSGGQRQRIALARVLLKNAPILVLDEATSALDSEAEAAIQDQLMGLMEGKTAIVIAHRLSTIAAMDRLIVMDQGRILEEGSHEELLTKGGLYASLWNRQSGGFLKSA
ncbi:MAG: ABC transporter ATP-binding protein [Hyphomicrobiales bacterium]